MLEIEHLAHFKYFILSFLISTVLLSQTHSNREIDKALKLGVSEIVKQNYRNSEQIFKQLDEEFNDNPLGKIYLAAVLIAESYDYATPFDEKRISSLFNDAKKLAIDQLNKDKQDIWNKYALALLEGYTAYYEAIRGNLLNALSIGLNSYTLFDEILKQDSSFYDALIAVGTYKYWRSKKLEFINWLPFIDDHRELGIKHLEISINNNSYNSHLAMHSLIWILIDKKDFNKAKNLAQYALRKFPQSRLFKEALARVYEDIDLNHSISLYYQVLESYENLELTNRIKVITLKHIIAIQYQKLGRRSKALKICDEILAIKDLNSYEMEKLESRLERVKKMQNDLRK
jgi:hypothetical protein